MATATASATAGIESLALSVDVAPLVDVLRLLAQRVDELHEDVKARDEAARAALAEQQEKIDGLLARAAEADAAARQAAESITPEEIIQSLLYDVLGDAVEIGERSVARRERAELFRRTDALESAEQALQVEAATLAQRQEEASRLTEQQFGSVKSELGALTQALEQLKQDAGGGLDELKSAVAAAAERLSAHDAELEEGRQKAAELVSVLRDELERSASELGARLERVEEVTGAMNDVNAELEAKVLAEANRLIEAEAEARQLVERSVEETAAVAKEEMGKLAGVLDAFKEQHSTDKQSLSDSIVESAETLHSQFEQQLTAVQAAVQEQIVSEVMEELSEDKLKPRLEQMGVDLSGQSANIARELIERLGEAHKRELEQLQTELARATELQAGELLALSERLAALSASISSSAELEELRGAVASKADAAALEALLEQLSALQEAVEALAKAKARASPGSNVMGVIQIGRDGQPRLNAVALADGTLQLTDGGSQAAAAGAEAAGGSRSPSPSLGSQQPGADEAARASPAPESAADAEREGSSDVALRILDANGNPTTWEHAFGGGGGGGGMTEEMSRELGMLKATIEEVRSAMKVKVDALALHRLRLQIASHVENVQKELLAQINSADGGGAKPAPAPQQRAPQPRLSNAPAPAPAAGISIDPMQARNLAAALQGHAQMQEMIVEQLAAHENELENLREMVGTFEGRGGLLARLHAQMGVLKRTVMDKADKDELNKRVVDTKRLEREVRAKIERHVGELQAMLAATAGDTAHTRRLLEERADLTKSYSEALFDGCIKAVATRVSSMQRSNQQQMVEQLTSIDEDILRLERALPAMGYFGPGHAAQRRAAAPRHVPARRSAPRPYNPLAQSTQMYAWDIRGGRPLPLVPVRHGVSINQPGAGGPTGALLGRRGSRDMASPIGAIMQAGLIRPGSALDGSSAPVERPRALPKLVIVGEKQLDHSVSKANVPRALTAADKVNYPFPQGAARTKNIWATSESTAPLTSMATQRASLGRR